MHVLPPVFLLVSAVIRLLGGLSYLRATIIGKAKPNPLTWLLWSITPAITLLAALSVGETDSLLVTSALALSPLLVFVTAVIKNPRSVKFDRLNLICALLAAVGMVLWYATSNQNLAIILAMLADFASSLPTLIKAKRQPHSEHPPAYIMSAIAMLLALLTMAHWTFTSAGFMIYILILNLIIANLSIFGRLRQVR